MKIVDIIIAVLMLLSIWSGWKKGLVYQIVSLISVFIGIYVASRFWHFMYNFLQSYLSWDEAVLKYASMILTATLVILGIILIGKLLSKLIEVTVFGIPDKIFGSLLSFIESVVVISFLIYGVNFFFPKNDLLTQKNIEKSYVLPYIEPIAVNIVNFFDKTPTEENIQTEEDKNIFVTL